MLCVANLSVCQTPFLKIYSTYSNQYDASLEVLEKIAKYQWFVGICEKKSNVENLIITPIQRIPRYSLLLSDLLRKTPKEHPDHYDIEKALTLTVRAGRLRSSPLMPTSRSCLTSLCTSSERCRGTCQQEHQHLQERCEADRRRSFSSAGSAPVPHP
jgi:hypothetical protein